jgi:hypothetical protein
MILFFTVWQRGSGCFLRGTATLSPTRITTVRLLMQYFKIKDWDNLQHYKDRNPPWIKLETDFFQDYEYSRLQDASKLLLLASRTLASRYRFPKEGLIPADFEYIKNQCCLGDIIKIDHLKELIDKGFIIDASNMLAKCLQLASPETERETEREAEVEGEIKIVRNKKKSAPPQKNYTPEFESFWKDYGSVGSKSKAALSFQKIEVGYEDVISGLRRYQAYARANAGWYSPQHASTWLNQRGWESEWQFAERPGDSNKQDFEQAAIRGMLRAENPNF